MLYKIKIKIEKELVRTLHAIDKYYSLSKISPLLFKEIKNFVLRKGKRLRPILFILAYMGFAKRAVSGLYTSSVSFELLHDFFIIHDDIIDKSDIRRNEPSMHKRLDALLSDYKKIKFGGEDLAIVIADVIYSMAMHAFMSINENPRRKEKALKRFIEAGIYTGSGEFIELLRSIKNIKRIAKDDIYKIYNLKTAHYSFASPLSTGAILAGASTQDINKLFRAGVFLGRAFQIKDDILGLFAEEKKIGKSSITDLQESKKTILIWYAYNNSKKQDKSIIEKILSKPKVDKSDLLKIQKIITESGSLDHAKKEISALLNKAESLIFSTRMLPNYKKSLCDYSKELLNLD